jgi:hypothetical protein
MILLDAPLAIDGSNAETAFAKFNERSRGSLNRTSRF